MDSLNQNLCLAPDQKMVWPKKVANDLKIDLADLDGSQKKEFKNFWIKFYEIAHSVCVVLSHHRTVPCVSTLKSSKQKLKLQNIEVLKTMKMR